MKDVIRGESLDYFGVFSKSSLEFRNLASNEGPFVRSVAELNERYDMDGIPIAERIGASLESELFQDKDLGIATTLKGTVSSTTTVDKVSVVGSWTCGAKLRLHTKLRMSIPWALEFTGEVKGP